MCGIIACRDTSDAAHYVLAALCALEYRGYDSVGLEVWRDGELCRVRSTDRASTLSADVPLALSGANVGIGHTRWATHGVVSERNAHPHHDCHDRFGVVHNGIIDNASALRAELVARGHLFNSDVDSEVLCHLVEDNMASESDLAAAVERATSALEGSWAFVVLDAYTGQLVGTATRSPLVVADSADGSFMASDVTAISTWCREYRVLNDGDIVELSDTEVWHRDGARVAAPPSVSTNWTGAVVPVDAVGDRMGVEIDEQPEVARALLDRLLPHVAHGELWRELNLAPFEKLRVLACGTSLNAGRVIAGCLQRLGGIPATIEVASEVTEEPFDRSVLTLAISQSGETADVLRALDALKADERQVLALTNNPYSSLARRAGAMLECSAGTEVGVAATKTFTCQVLAGACWGISALVALGRLDELAAGLVVEHIKRMPERLSKALQVTERTVPALIDDVREASGFIFLARGTALPYAAEGALKLKELSYRWAEHYPAGELKHGPLALVSDGTPVIVIDNGDPRLPGNIAEVKTRGARVIDIGDSGSRIPVVHPGIAPLGPLEAAVPLQSLARLLALALGHDVDKPRNLAKSVTVI